MPGPGDSDWAGAGGGQNTELHVSVVHLCGLQHRTWEVEPSNPGHFRCGGPPRTLALSSGG